MVPVNRYLIANILSGVSAVFTVASSWVPDKKKSYLLQVGQCLVYAAASVFFGMYATVVTMLLCAARNGLEAYEKFRLGICVPFCVVIAVLGAVFNRSGLLGFLPVIATVVYSLGCCLYKSLLSTKLNIFADLTIWAVYDILIADIPSSIIDSIGALVALAAFFRIRKMLADRREPADPRENAPGF